MPEGETWAQPGGSKTWHRFDDCDQGPDFTDSACRKTSEKNSTIWLEGQASPPSGERVCRECSS